MEWRYHAHCDFTVMIVKKMRNIPHLLKQIPKDGAFTQHDAKDEEKDLMDAQPIRVSDNEEEASALLDQSLGDIWVTYSRNVLQYSDKKIIEKGMLLTDKHIGLAQNL